jgi:PAS domain S-box-containing protein
MPDFLERLFSSNGFMPHGHCYLWNPGLVWLHVASDALTALAYTSIPFTLVYFVRKRRDIPFNWMFLCFGVFIIACGATHYMEIWTLWTPTYWLSGVIKAITALASVPTAVLLIRLVPKALVIPTPEQLSIANSELQRAHEALERRVQERTAELTAKNEELAKEIVERKRVEEALLRSERRFRRLADSGILGIISTTVKGDILDANQAFLDMLGYTAEEIRSGHPNWADLTPPEWRVLDDRANEQLREHGVAVPWEKEYICKDGRRVPIMAGVAMVDANVGECIAFILDLTELKQAQAAIESLRTEREGDLKASIQVRDDFLAIAGHELKTPLAALLLQIQSLQRVVKKNGLADLDTRLEKAARSGLRLERLINQLLDVSRITAGRLQLEAEPCNLTDIIREVVSRFAEQAVITFDTAAPVIGRWDRLRIDQVVNNLIGNALKYGEGKPVEVSLRIENEDAVLRVVDHGIGIDEEHQLKIFQRFERAVGSRDFGGFGLGLWIARQIVEASGGGIGVRSKPGEGATFVVRLPLHDHANAFERGDVAN